MENRIRRALGAVAACVVATTSLTLAAASPAAAFGEETFGCRVSPGAVFTFDTVCTNRTAASAYNIGFVVQNTSGSYTYSWSITGPYQSVISGCTSTSAGCTVYVTSSADRDIAVTVTYSQNGQSATKNSLAIINAVCGGELC